MPDKLVRDPIYKQLNEALRGLISNGEFKLGDKFLSEREIGERFSVSRATANKALSTLVAEGILSFRKGVGTFVHGPVLHFDLRTLVSFTEKAAAAGKRPSTEVLSAAHGRAAELAGPLAQKLGVPSIEAVYYLERLRLADDEPVILERRFVVARHCPKLLEEDLSGSLYGLWTERYGLELGGAEQAIRAVVAGEAEQKRLDLEPGAPCLLVVCRGHLSSGEVLWWEHTLYRGDAYEFRTELGPLRSGSPLKWAFIDAASI